MYRKYSIKRSNRLRGHSVQEINVNSDVEIRKDTTVENGSGIVAYDKKKREILLIEAGITSQDQLQVVEKENRCISVRLG